jgi:hypothetical protein
MRYGLDLVHCEAIEAARALVSDGQQGIDEFGCGLNGTVATLPTDGIWLRIEVKNFWLSCIVCRVVDLPCEQSRP